MQYTREQVYEAMQRVIDSVSVPVREPSYNDPSFWSEALTITRTRIIPGRSGWLDYLTVTPKEGYPRVIKSYVATPYEQTAGLPSLMEFRWVRRQTIEDTTQIILDPGVERHVDRYESEPWPAFFRKVRFYADDTSRFALQVRNRSRRAERAIAAVTGWYYPELQSPGEITSQQGVTDALRSF